MGALVRVWVVTGVFLLAGCGPAQEPRAVDSATPWEYQGTDSTVPFDQEAFASDLTDLVTALPAFNPYVLLAAYQEARTYGDEACPPEDTLATDDADLVWWYGGCLTESGVHFNGVMTGWGWSGQDLSQQAVVDLEGAFPAGFAWDGQGFEGRIDIFDTAGSFDFSCSCEAVATTGQAPDGSTARLEYTRGPAFWWGPDSGGTWLQDDEHRATVRFTDVVGGDVHRVTGDAKILGPGDGYRGLSLVTNALVQLDGDTLTCGEVTADILSWDAQSGASVSFSAQHAQGDAGCVACADLEGGEVCVDMAPVFHDIVVGQ